MNNKEIKDPLGSNNPLNRGNQSGSSKAVKNHRAKEFENKLKEE